MKFSDIPRSHFKFSGMSDEQKKKTGVIANGIYKTMMSIGMIVVVLQIGGWKTKIEDSTFKNAEELIEYKLQVEDNTEDIDLAEDQLKMALGELVDIKHGQVQFSSEVLKAIEDLDKKVQWNFNRINNQK